MITYQVKIRLRQGGLVQVEVEFEQSSYPTSRDIYNAAVEQVKKDLPVSSERDMDYEIDHWAPLRKLTSRR